jgi:hypothetical protein
LRFQEVGMLDFGIKLYRYRYRKTEINFETILNRVVLPSVGTSDLEVIGSIQNQESQCFTLRSTCYGKLTSTNNKRQSLIIIIRNI